jgi:protoporphyrinogen oxidase
LKILIAGAGVMGLAAALDLLEEGHEVEVFEAAERPGGLAGSFDFGSVRAEKFYHFDLPVCGLIEYTNLNPPEAFGGQTVLYSPLYIPASHPRYRSPENEVLEETLEDIARIVPGFDRSTIVDYRVFREPFAQPVCPVGFTSRLAPLRTPVRNLVAADTTHLLPHDRSISDSLALAQKLLGAFREAMALPAS